MFLRPEACNFTKKETLAQVFSCEFCEISKNAFFTEHLWATASINGNRGILFWPSCFRMLPLHYLNFNILYLTSALAQYFQESSLPNVLPILAECSISIPPGNIRKPKVF